MAEPTVELDGKTFGLQTGKMAGFAWAEFLALAGDDDANMSPGLVMALMESSIVEKDWQRFKTCAYRLPDFFEKEFIDVLKARMEAAEGEHPTGLPSDSTDGQETTPPKSDANLDAKVFRAVNGRPDLYAIQMEALEHSA